LEELIQKDSITKETIWQPTLILFQNFYDAVIVFCPVREGTIRTNLDFSSLLFKIGRISRTLLQTVHGTITKQAVQLLQALMAGIIFTI
jgi:hypothetical protein